MGGRFAPRMHLVQPYVGLGGKFGSGRVWFHLLVPVFFLCVYVDNMLLKETMTSFRALCIHNVSNP